MSFDDKVCQIHYSGDIFLVSTAHSFENYLMSFIRISIQRVSFSTRFVLSISLRLSHYLTCHLCNTHPFIYTTRRVICYILLQIEHIEIRLFSESFLVTNNNECQFDCLALAFVLIHCYCAKVECFAQFSATVDGNDDDDDGAVAAAASAATMTTTIKCRHFCLFSRIFFFFFFSFCRLL